MKLGAGIREAEISAAGIGAWRPSSQEGWQPPSALVISEQLRLRGRPPVLSLTSP